MAFSEDIRTCLSFDDVMLVPKKSSIASRHDVDLTVYDWNGDPLKIAGNRMLAPIFAAPMDTIVDARSAAVMAKLGVVPILHRYCKANEQRSTYKHVQDLLEGHQGVSPVGAAISSKPSGLDQALQLSDLGCNLFCVDVAHGYHEVSLRAVEELRKSIPDAFIIAGNVATRDAFDALADVGASAIRVGVGGGAVCTTRLVTGHGIPTFQSVVDCAQSDRECYLIADGGLKTTGDMVKAYAAGADMCMLGSMLACKRESPGEVRIIDGQLFKRYRGMASKSAQQNWRGRVSVVEGSDSWRPITEDLGKAIERISAGIKSGLSYSGCTSLESFYGMSDFVRITPNSLRENSPHGSGVESNQ